MRIFYLLLICAPLAACDSPPANAKEPRSSPASAAGVGKKAEPTPEIIDKAEQILRANADAEYGKEIPFQLNGKRYVARVEEHDNSTNEPGRPRGKHKGVTVYER